eukprot:7035891-Alexandrium_andersonii.AAC.1
MCIRDRDNGVAQGGEKGAGESARKRAANGDRPTGRGEGPARGEEPRQVEAWRGLDRKPSASL